MIAQVQHKLIEIVFFQAHLHDDFQGFALDLFDVACPGVIGFFFIFAADGIEDRDEFFGQFEFVEAAFFEEEFHFSQFRSPSSMSYGETFRRDMETESDRQIIPKNPSSNRWPYFIILEGLNYEVKFFHQPR